MTKQKRNKNNKKGANMLNFLNNLKNKSNGNDLPLKKIGFSAPQEECWESGIEVITACGTAPKAVPITIGQVAKTKIDILMQLYPKIEWLAYLCGEGHNVTDIVIPNQEVTSVRVDVSPEGVGVPTIGVIHSHHGMGNGFSGTDHAYINQNHGISLCISHKGIAGQVRVPTSCGKLVIVPAQVLIAIEGVDTQTFITDAKNKIKEKKSSFDDIRMNINNIGIEEMDEVKGIGGVKIDTNNSIIVLSDAIQNDIENDPFSFETIDLIGLKEIIGEVLNPHRNYDRFISLYTNFYDNNTLYDEKETDDQVEVYGNPAEELIDELDASFENIKNSEKTALINLFKSLKEAVNINIKVESLDKPITQETADNQTV